MQAKGLDIQGLANALEQHRVTVEKDLRSDKLTQKVLKKYSRVLDLSIDEFYENATPVKPVVVAAASDNAMLELYKKLCEEKDKRIELLENQIRFFPNAVQVA